MSWPLMQRIRKTNIVVKWSFFPMSTIIIKLSFFGVNLVTNETKQTLKFLKHIRRRLNSKKDKKLVF